MQTALATQPSCKVVPIKRTALRLINTTLLSHDEWLGVRKQGIGSSDSAAAVGLNPYKSQLELWLEKTGRDQQIPKPDLDDDSTPLFWGTLLESFVAQHYAKKTKRKVRRVNAVLQHVDYPWMLANLDREVVCCDEVQVLECKTAGMNGAKLWRDGVPEYVQLQVMHQLAVTGKQAADVAVLVCGNEFRIHRIQRDERLISKLIELEQRFWHYVESDTQPPVDGSDSAAFALQCLYPQDTGTVLNLSEDGEMSTAFADLVAVRQTLETQEQLEAKLKQRIQQRMGDASKAIFGTGEVTWKRSKDIQTLDTANLIKAQPELLQQFPLTRAGSRRFLVSA